MKHNIIIVVICAIILYILLLVWIRNAYINTYEKHVVTPVVLDKWHFPVQHRYKSRRWIDTAYIMCVKSPKYGYAHLNVDDITYNNHVIKDTLLFEWTNRYLAVFDSKYDKGLMMDFTFVLLLSIMLGLIILWVSMFLIVSIQCDQ